ncbi:hypothetical protein VKT23_017655 [Stygiomarasmius scandens]|uniref:Hpc2-related domain-containing protein n=1 Tax=Marasmiellus scandens TaxID=2682957 RepID=A0ABR1IVL2_9AGAR
MAPILRKRQLPTVQAFSRVCDAVPVGQHPPAPPVFTPPALFAAVFYWILGMDSARSSRSRTSSQTQVQTSISLYARLQGTTKDNVEDHCWEQEEDEQGEGEGIADEEGGEDGEEEEPSLDEGEGDDNDEESEHSVGVEDDIHEVNEVPIRALVEPKATTRDGDVKMGVEEETKPIAFYHLAAVSTPAVAPTTTKPVSKAKSKSEAIKERSPSPPPVASRPPLQTVRLHITLDGPENYEVDIAQMARDIGQRLPSPIPKLGIGDAESSGGDGGKAKSKSNSKTTAGAGTSILGAAMAAYKASQPAEKPKKKRKKPSKSDDYDVSDPFIDDSELAVDHRKYFAQTKQAGFYVSSGEVALLKGRSSPVKKPKSKKAPLTIHTHVVTSLTSSDTAFLYLNNFYQLLFICSNYRRSWPLFSRIRS